MHNIFNKSDYIIKSKSIERISIKGLNRFKITSRDLVNFNGWKKL